MSSNYPDGFASGVTIRGVPIQQLHPGNIYWVSNTTVLPDGADISPSDGNDGSFLRPFKTIDYAIGQCKADRGDIIMVAPGYTETIANATSLLMDVAGIAIIGCGLGGLRPTLSFSGTGSNIPITAENMSITNVLFESTVENCASAFTATGTATPKNLTIENCEFRDTGAALSFTAIVSGNATANCLDGFNFLKNKVHLLDATALTTCIKVIIASDHVRLMDNEIVTPALNDTPALATFGNKIMLDLVIGRNRVFRPSTVTATPVLYSGTGATCTGYVFSNYVWHLDSAGGNGLMASTGMGLGFAENYCHTTAGANFSPVINPARI